MAANLQDSPLNFLRSRRGLAIALVAFVVVLFLIRPGANRMKGRITRSISVELQRPVDIKAVSLRLLPTPGFDLANFVLYDDQSFGAEPMVQASEVTATLRVTSLLSGRLEVARLDLTDPSINLVRDDDGHWNLESLLERAAKNPLAPTTRHTGESRTSFPYVEADGARINLKLGQEKKSYALTEADFSFWQDGEDAWGMRLKAKPMRTDFNVTDTGLLKVNGTWQRASNLRDTPLQFNIQWSDAQLGQVTKLIYGEDKGWRGAVRLSVLLTGTPADLTISGDSSVQDFRRYDILAPDPVRLQASCTGHYSTADKNLSNLVCRAPVGEGAITLAGSVNAIPGMRGYDLTFIARDIPVKSLAGFIACSKKDMPQDLAAEGMVNATLRMQRPTNGSGPVWSGAGEALAFKLSSKINDTTLGMSRIPFTVSSDEENRIDVGPLNLPVGRPGATTAHGWLSAKGYGLAIQGDAQVNKLLQLARTVGLRTPQVAADGGVKLDLQVAGVWSGFHPPVVTGKALLHSVRGEVRGLGAPVEISSATIVLTPNNTNILFLTASLGSTAWKGAVALPRPCSLPDACPVHFDLRTDQLSTDELSRILHPSPGKRPWYKFLSPSPPAGVPFLRSLQASGKIAVTRADIHGLAATHVYGNVEISQGKLRISELRGDILGGRHDGEFRATFTGKIPEYNGSGTLDRVALLQVGQWMGDPWISGTADLKFQASASGWSVQDLLSSATANLETDARDGVLTHITLPNNPPRLRMRSLTTQLVLNQGLFEIREGKLETPTGIYQVSGTASLGRVLDIKLIREGGHSFNISGTLTQPRVTAAVAADTQAALKP
jgi:hypothetical protein